MGRQCQGSQCGDGFRIRRIESFYPVGVVKADYRTNRKQSRGQDKITAQRQEHLEEIFY